MSNTVKLILISGMIAMLTACSSKKEDALEPAGISYKTNEITVRQCLDINNQEFTNLLKEHDTVIKKQMSPHLYIVTWDDDRSADEVVLELNKTAMFCGVDKYQE